MSEMGKKVTKNGTKVTETQASKTRKINGCRVRDQIRIPLPLVFYCNFVFRSSVLEIRSPDRPCLLGAELL